MNPEVVVVGAGLAGLACARTLTEAGVPTRVYEAADAVGGRVRTDAVDGFLLDRGFQVLLTAYPEAQRQLDYDALELRPFKPGAFVRHGGGFKLVADPFREPLSIIKTLLSGVGNLGDKARILKLRQAVVDADESELWDRPEIPARTALQQRYGFSDEIIEAFFEPFMGGVLLDRGLAQSSRAFEYYFRMFALGEAAVPANGMQAIPDQLAARLPAGTVQLSTPVDEVRPDGVTLFNGERVEARAVVVATDEPQAAALLRELDTAHSRGATCLYFSAFESPHEEPRLVLDGSRSGPVVNLAVMSDVSERYAPASRHLISATVIGTPGRPPEDLEVAVRNQLRGWYGARVDGWETLAQYRIEHALPDQTPPALQPPQRPVLLEDGVFVCGDHRANASIDGALASGRWAGESVLARLKQEA